MTTSRIPAINQPWPEQGGIYIGSRLIDGHVHHIVIPGGGVEYDTKVAFADVHSCIPHEINRHSDWRVPEQEDLMLAWINAREHFVREGGMDSFYWSCSIQSGFPWAVHFEGGLTHHSTRYNEFRVRPFRRFPDSTL